MQARTPQRLRLKRWMYAGIALLVASPILALGGLLVGMLRSFHTIESMQAPTPGQLATGVKLSLFAFAGGALVGVCGAALLLLAVFRLQSLDRAEQASSTAS
jgi:hypothetical protein